MVVLYHILCFFPIYGTRGGRGRRTNQRPSSLARSLRSKGRGAESLVLRKVLGGSRIALYLMQKNRLDIYIYIYHSPVKKKKYTYNKIIRFFCLLVFFVACGNCFFCLLQFVWWLYTQKSDTCPRPPNIFSKNNTQKQNARNTLTLLSPPKSAVKNKAIPPIYKTTNTHTHTTH